MILLCKFIETLFYSFKKKKSHSPTCVQKINHQQSSTKIISNAIVCRMKPFIPEPKNGQDLQTDHSKMNHNSHQKYNAPKLLQKFPPTSTSKYEYRLKLQTHPLTGPFRHRNLPKMWSKNYTHYTFLHIITLSSATNQTNTDIP